MKDLELTSYFFPRSYFLREVAFFVSNDERTVCTFLEKGLGETPTSCIGDTKWLANTKLANPSINAIR